MSESELASVRADLWLWAARLYKTRSLAKAALDGGKVKRAGLPLKPSSAVRGADWLDIDRVDGPYRLEVLALADVRGPATVARTLYREDSEVRTRRLAEAALRRLDGFRPPTARPNSAARAELLRLKQQRP